MSMIAMAAPSPYSAFTKRDYPWEGARSHSEYNTRQTERVALPPIRQAFPELQLRVHDAASRTSATTSPTVGPTSVMTPPEYVHSPNSNKRRRLSFEEEREVERASRVPRLYTGAADAQRHASPAMPPRSAATESWTSSAGTSPFMPSGGMPSMRSPMAVEMNEQLADPRPTLPSLPHMPFEREAAHAHREYPSRPVAMSAGPAMEAASSPYRTAPAGYPSYHHPTRLQSLSAGAIHPFDSTPYAAGGYGHHDFVRYGDFGTMGMGGEDKRRKRRGNLPRVTTDKLRAWFLDHLDHPYPTEDEKQELMRQTGLQMNQISNWFINARRRQLPQMINNARAESNAAASRDGEAKILPTTEPAEFEDKGSSAPLSDGEGYGDNLGMKGQRAAHVKRGSI